LYDNVSRIIRWYKGRTTFESRKIRPGFAWQTRFYDHIIRNRTSEDNIRRYIWNNPARWKEDRFYL
jgi:REP element-mobilizing transposase RayT